jgi:hypothetical protein
MHHLSKHLKDLPSYHLEAFSEHEAKDFISRLDIDKNIQFTEGHIQHILNKLVWYQPYFIQLLLIEHNGNYIFRSPLLRDYWYNRFVK